MSLASVLETMTYKPTYQFEIVDINGSQVLRVTMHTHDSRPDEAPPLSIPVDFPVPDYPVVGIRIDADDNYHPTVVDTDEAWQEWIDEHIISWCEMHEKYEWLRFNGVLYHDPHNESMIR